MLLTEKQINSWPLWFKIMFAALSIGIIAFIWAITINPIEFIKFKRDKQRVYDLTQLSNILQQLDERELLQSDHSKKVVYVSLPDSDPYCSTWNLPPLAKGFVYKCVDPQHYRHINGRGWLPVDFSSFNPSFNKLPVDPLNDDQHFYQYIPGSFSISASQIESRKMQEELSAVTSLRITNKFLQGNNFPNEDNKLKIAFTSNMLVLGNSLNRFFASLPLNKQQEFRESMKKVLQFPAQNQYGRNSSKTIDQFIAYYITSPASQPVFSADATKDTDRKRFLPPAVANSSFPANLPSKQSSTANQNPIPPISPPAPQPSAVSQTAHENREPSQQQVARSNNLTNSARELMRTGKFPNFNELPSIVGSNSRGYIVRLPDKYPKRYCIIPYQRLQ